MVVSLFPLTLISFGNLVSPFDLFLVAFVFGIWSKVMVYLKCQKLYVEQLIRKREDRITNLPVCLLLHILSFLPTRDAVRTSVLSESWRFLWTSLPNMDFDDTLHFGDHWDSRWRDKTCFVNFVERFLAFREMSSIKRFRLSYRVFFEAPWVNSWLSRAVRHKPQELNLCLFVNEPFILPSCIFMCESLTVLKIEMTSEFKPPDKISFPCLKTLHLSLVTFTNDGSIEKLFSSCPVLQELAIVDCEWMELKSITISIPTLRSLNIDDLPCFGLNDINDCEIKIYAANLRSFRYIGHLSNVIMLHDLSSLVFASVYLRNSHQRENEVAWRGIKLLTGLHKVKCLKISNDSMKSIFLAESLLDCLPVFWNLTRLELAMEIEYHTLRALMNLLQAMPNLESLVFAKGFDPHTGHNEDEWNPTQLNSSFLPHLKMIKLQNFHGEDVEISLLAFLLKYASLLEGISLKCSEKLLGDLNKKNEVSSQLQMLSRASEGCAIIFL